LSSLTNISNNYKNIKSALILFFLSLIAAFAISKGGFIALGALVAIPVLGIVIYKIFNYPAFGIILILYIAFSINGSGKYVELPFGLLVDFMLFLTAIAAIFYVKKKELSILTNGTVLLTSIWFFYCVLELVNPEPHSYEGWFYAVRASALYLFVTVILCFLVFNKEKDLDTFFNIWFLGSLIGALYGLKQLYLGLNSAEHLWVTTVGATTHLIFGQLRVFSIYSDAGQFGAIMGYTAVVGIILGIKNKSRNKKLFFIITSILCLYGMVISGTRGATFIPIVGFLCYFVLSKNFKVVVIGLVVLGSIFGILKFTFIGQDNYNIQRLRSSVNPTEDLSFQVRLKNQAKLKEYLASRPFGGGIGTIGYWGEKFMPGTFLAETPPDSWYVLLWGETGVVGLVIYFSMLLYILGRSFLKIFVMPDSYMKQKLIALFCGLVGIVVASYANPVLGQMPCSIHFYLSIVFLHMGTTYWVKKPDETQLNAS